MTPLSEESRPPSNAAVTFLRAMAGKAKERGLSFGHGGCGCTAQRAQDGFDTHFLRKFNALRYPRQPKSPAW